jgi:hypothetical protein
MYKPIFGAQKLMKPVNKAVQSMTIELDSYTMSAANCSTCTIVYVHEQNNNI